MKKFICAVMCIVLIAGAFSGCKAKHLEAYIYFELSKAPLSLDPQTASDENELMIARNLYEGLFRRDKNGEIKAAAVKDYQKEGLTYTFNLRDDLCYSDATPLLAKDFVFGIKRAINPETKSPYASRLFAIKNARAINEQGADISTLGIKAIEDKKLEITLEYEDEDFFLNLTTPAAMPCNEAFFSQTKGKYGRDVESILSNGSYRIAKWNKETFGIRLYQNKEYSGDFPPSNAAVFISSANSEKEEKEDIRERLTKGRIDMALLKNTDITWAKENGFNINTVNNICWVLTLGGELSPNIKKALAVTVNGEKIKQSLSEGFISATSIYPEIISEGNSFSYSYTPPYNLEAAKQIISAEIKASESGKFPSTTLTYFANDAFKPAINAIVGHWQQNLSAFVNTKAETKADYFKNEAKEKSLAMAIFPISAKSERVSEYLLNFGVENTDLAKAQDEILADNTLIPLAFENTNIVSASSIKELYPDNSDGYIDFAYVIKEE